MTATSEDFLTFVLGYARGGLSLVPCSPRDKRPDCGLLPRGEDGKPTWKPYQTIAPDEATIRRWSASGCESVAAACGAVSGGLLVLDFDEPRFFDTWLEEVGDLANGLPVQCTGGGGVQVWVRCPEPGKNDKLAWVSDEAEDAGRRIAIETRGEGGYAILPGSLHPSGNRYEAVGGDFTAIPLLSQAHADALIAAARKLDEAPLTRQQSEARATTSEAHRGSSDRHDNVIDAYNAAHRIEEALEDCGYTRMGQRYARPNGRHPTVSLKDGRSFHWGSNDPLCDGYWHRPFDIFCHYKHGGDCKAAVRAAADILGIPPRGRSTCSGEGAPSAPDEAYRPFPVDALPEPLSPFVANGAEAIGCDPAYIAVPLLSGLAAAIGNTRRVQLKRGWQEPSVVWAGTVGDSGTLKSPALDLALRPLWDIQSEARREYEVALAAHKIAAARRQAALSPRRARNSREAGDDPPDAPDEPVPDRYICSDTTVEALALLLSKSPRGLLLARDELAGWLRSFDAYRQGRGGDAEYWLTAHGARPWVIDRKTGTNKSIYVPRAAVSVTGSIQPDTLRRALGRQFFENGLAARLLLAMPPRTPKRWSDREVSSTALSAVGGLFEMVRDLQFGVGRQGEPVPIDLPLSPEARECFIEFYNEFAEQQDEIVDGDLRAAWAKIEGYAPRFALVLHMARVGRGDAPPDAVDAVSMSAGIRLARWFAVETRRVYQILKETDGQRRDRRLIDFIRARGGQVTARDLMRAGPCFATADEAQRVLNGFAEGGVGVWTRTTSTPRGGRPAEVFILREAAAADTSSSPAALSGGETGCVNAEATQPAAQSPLAADTNVQPHPSRRLAAMRAEWRRVQGGDRELEAMGAEESKDDDGGADAGEGPRGSTLPEPHANESKALPGQQLAGPRDVLGTPLDEDTPDPERTEAKPEETAPEQTAAQRSHCPAFGKDFDPRASQCMDCGEKHADVQAACAARMKRRRKPRQHETREDG